MIDALLSLPVLSYFALPWLSSYSTSLNLLFFYMTWSTLVLSHSPLNVIFFGTLAVRALFYVLPSLLFLAFDTGVPSLAVSLKAQRDAALPARKGGRKVAKVVGLSVFNVVLGVALQAGIEMLLTGPLEMRSAMRVTTALPMPWGIATDLVKGFVVRNVLQYYLHRYVLHGHSVFSQWHKTWQHSVRVPYSFVANYDHPVAWLIGHWIPAFLPAIVFRYHILTFNLMMALISLEETFAYSGYTVLPSNILLAGIARRHDAHMMTGGKGNFAPWGVLDWLHGTNLGPDVVDDVKQEIDKHDVPERSGTLLQGAGKMVDDVTDRVKKRGRGRPRKNQSP